MNSPTLALRIALALVASALAASTLAGCGEGEALQHINVDGDPRKVSDVVEAFNECSTDVARSSKLFAGGATPKGPDAKKYGRFAYFPTGEAKVSGDAASIAVSLREEKTSKDLGAVEWSFKKEGDAWKIASAPLP